MKTLRVCPLLPFGGPRLEEKELLYPMGEVQGKIRGQGSVPHKSSPLQLPGKGPEEYMPLPLPLQGELQRPRCQALWA